MADPVIIRVFHRPQRDLPTGEMQLGVEYAALLQQASGPVKYLVDMLVEFSVHMQQTCGPEARSYPQQPPPPAPAVGRRKASRVEIRRRQFGKYPARQGGGVAVTTGDAQVARIVNLDELRRLE